LGALINKNNTIFWESCGGQAKVAIAKHLVLKKCIPTARNLTGGYFEEGIVLFHQCIE